MILEIGGCYSNNFGEYEVLAIKGDNMEVRYTDGHRQVLSVETQTRIQEKRLLSQSITPQALKSRRQISHDSTDYWTLGFLLARLSHLQFNVMAEKKDNARCDYFDATGEELDSVQEGISFLREGANQWGNQGVIIFQASSSELPLLRFKGNPYPVASSIDVYEVKDISYVRFMWENGFRMGPGSKQDKNKIISSVPKASRDAFDRGYNRGSKPLVHIQ